MAKSSWVVNPEPPYNLIPKDQYQRPEKAGYHIMPDMPDFVSPIDGKVVKGRRGYRAHCREHSVTNMSDFTETWKADTVKRKNFTKSREQRTARIEALKEAYDKQRER